MKNYETGICAHCSKTKENHHFNWERNYCYVGGNSTLFKDSGLAQLESNAHKLLEALEELHEASTGYMTASKYYIAGVINAYGHDKALVRLAKAEESAKEAINEALKR